MFVRVEDNTNQLPCTRDHRPSSEHFQPDRCALSTQTDDARVPMLECGQLLRRDRRRARGRDQPRNGEKQRKRASQRIEYEPPRASVQRCRRTLERPCVHARLAPDLLQSAKQVAQRKSMAQAIAVRMAGGCDDALQLHTQRLERRRHALGRTGTRDNRPRPTLFLAQFGNAKKKSELTKPPKLRTKPLTISREKPKYAQLVG